MVPARSKVYENRIFQCSDGTICRIKKVLEYDDENASEYFNFTALYDFMLKDGTIYFDVGAIFTPIKDEHELTKDEDEYRDILEQLFKATIKFGKI